MRRPLRLAFGVATAALVLAPLATTAQNLGRLALLSRLGEPLDAQIEITAVPPEAQDSLSAQIVPIGVFERFGVTPSPPLEAVRASVERSADGRPVVRLRSTVPVDKPSVNMIIELSWNGGRMVRQYAFNVDPPERAVARADTQSPAPRADAPSVAAPKAAAPKPTAAPKEKVAAAPKENVAPKAERPRAPAGPSERDVAAAEDRVKNLERTMRELQEKIDARNREIEALQRQVGGTPK